MTEEQVGAEMYEMGYRYRIVFEDNIRQPLYVKTIKQISALMRNIYPTDRNWIAFRVDSQGQSYGLSDIVVKDNSLHGLAIRALRQRENLSKSDSAYKNIKNLYDAGWSDNGEWTCALCGVMIGKNLNGARPFALANEHAEQCCD